MVGQQNHSDGIEYHAQSQSRDEYEYGENISVALQYWISESDDEMIDAMYEPSNKDNCSEEGDESISSDEESAPDSQDGEWTPENYL